MEHTDWLDDGLNPAEARFLMLTAITHHHFSSPIWGEHEVRKLHAELVELDWLATQAAASHRRLPDSSGGGPVSGPRPGLRAVVRAAYIVARGRTAGQDG